MANSIDPDQTASSEAVWSWSALFAETYLSQYIEFVRYSRPNNKFFMAFHFIFPGLYRDSTILNLQEKCCFYWYSKLTVWKMNEKEGMDWWVDG